MKAFVFFLALVACGGQTQGASDGGPDAGNGCPTTAPADGDDCNVDLQCEYGSDPRWTCNTVATCKQGFWSVSGAGSDCPTPATNPPACSSVQQYATCSDTSVACNEGNTFCACEMGGYVPIPDAGPPSAEWICAQLDPQCPASRPKLGTSCAQANLMCSYTACGTPSGLDVECDETTHTWIGAQEFCAGAN